MNERDIRSKVWAFIEPQTVGRNPSDSDDLFAEGYVNSLFAMQIVRFIQSHFDLTLTAEDMNFDNFRTIGGIVQFVESKLDRVETAP